MKGNIFLFLFIFYVLISTTLFINDTTYASPPWLTVGFYAKYSIVNAYVSFFNVSDPFNPIPIGSLSLSDANGTLFWKVEKIEGNYALIKINISVVGKYWNATLSAEMTGSFSRTFHLLVDVNSRFILNTTKDDPFYFIYWIPIGTKINETTFIGHYKFMNSWIVGKFYGYGYNDFIETNWKKIYKDDVITLFTENETSTYHPEPGRTYMPPVFELLYDKKTGILIQILKDPLLLRFLSTEINAFVTLKDITEEIHFTNGTVKTRRLRSYILIDSIGNEPVYESSKNESSKVNEVHSILISSFLAPPKIEAGKEFELSVTILNNGTVDENNLNVLLRTTNESIKFISSKEFLINSIQPKESKEIKWKVILLSEGKYILDFNVVKNETTLAQKTFVIMAEASLIQKIFPFVASLSVLAFLFTLILWLKHKHMSKHLWHMICISIE